MVWFADLRVAGERAADSGGFGRAMQLGFNTNFRYRDVIFHVQTEDSGRANPHVITHLFHGGNIIASVKSDYSDLLEEQDVEAAVRRLMESQHKAMLKQLSRGEHDGVIRERLGAEIFGASPAPTSVSRTSSATSSSESGAMPRSAAKDSAAPTGAARPAAEPTVVAPERRESSSGLARVFGERIVSEKPLDEVVLDYLVENARKRKRQPKS